MGEKDVRRYSFRVQFLACTLERRNLRRAQCRGLGPSAALAGFDDHVGELLHFSRSAHVVEDGERLEVLRNAAGGSGRLGVQRVVQAQQLSRNQEIHCNACLNKDGAHLGHVYNRQRGGQSNTLHWLCIAGSFLLVISDLQQKTAVSKSCCVMRCTVNKLNRFYKLSTPKKTALKDTNSYRCQGISRWAIHFG